MAKPFGGSGLPAALFHYSRDRGGTHPRGHPAGWSGILQADAYAGFNGLYAKGRAPAPLTEASCWAHGGARFFELADLAKAMRAPMAIEAVRRIDGNRRRPWSSPDAYLIGDGISPFCPLLWQSSAEEIEDGFDEVAEARMELVVGHFTVHDSP